MATGLTPNYSLPYPLQTDPVNVAGDIEQLADRLDDILQETIEDTSSAMWTTGGTFGNGLQAPTYNDSTGKMSMSLSQDLQTSASPTFSSITLTGDIAINGGDITTSSTTFNLVNSSATTINLGGAATVINMGSASGQLNISGDLNIGSGKQYKINSASVLSSTTLGSSVVNSSLTSVGTITSGAWSATEIAVNKGGTGLTSFDIGDIIYASGSATLEKLSAVDTGNALISGGSETAPSWGKIGLSTHVSGTLPVANGGTGVTTSTGTGNLVLSSSPTLTSPTLGEATATSVNKVILTEPANSATITISNNKTLSVSNTLTLTGTDSSSINFGAGGTVIYQSNKISDLSTTTSSELAGKISDETGSGSLVFATSPNITTPIISGHIGISGNAATVESASAISASGSIFFVSGSATISEISSPFGTGNSGQITIIPSGEFTTDTLGNIALETTAVINRALIMTYDSGTQKWYPSY